MNLKRILLAGFGLALVLGLWGGPNPLRAQETSEAMALPGLQGEVRVEYDAFGVPHIYASNEHDLYFMQGYLTAQDRWWQMEWARHQSRGRLSELMGPNLVGTDTFLRTLGLVPQAEAALAIASPEAVVMFEAYAAGVNTWLEGQTPETAAIEYGFLGVLGTEITSIEPWTPLDSVAYGQAVALSFAQGNIENELVKQGLIDAAGPFAPVLLAPPFDYEQFPLVSAPGGQASMSSSPTPRQTAATAPSISTLGGDPWAAMAALPFPAQTLRGSNSWVVSGELTDTGMPFLANDPHIGQNNPSVWYEQGLHCVELNDNCRINAYGHIFPGAPGILIGHNQFLAWGMTVSGLDTIDLYALELNPENPNQYQYEGEWLDMDIRTETIAVAGAEPVSIEIRETRFGPVINGLLGMETPLAARIVAAEPGRSMEIVYWLPRAQNWEEFQAGVALFDFTGQNFVYADVEGNIGVVSGGRMPLRVEGHDGSLPVPGVDASFEWLGFLDKADNPRVFNPESGFIVAANNAFARPEDLPSPMAVYYDYGYRARRIENLLMAQEQHNIESMMAIQTDNFNPASEFMVPALLALDFGDPALNEARDWLGEWDLMNNADSGQAALFNAFWLKLMPLAFDEMAAAGGVSGDSKDIYIMTGMMQTQNPLWRNAELGIDNREEQLILAFTQGYEMLVAELGPDYQSWRWDAVHISEPQHVPLGQLPLGADPTLDTFIPSLNRFFNPSYGVDGGTASVNNQRWDATNGNLRLSGSVVSMRMVIDFSNLDNSKFSRELGQVGNPLSPNFNDMTPFWVNGEYRPYGFTPEAVAALSVRTLNFRPAE